MDRGAWQATVHRIMKNCTWLTGWQFHFSLIPLLRLPALADISWKQVRNLEFQTAPDLLNQNLYFNKIHPHVICVHIKVWEALICVTWLLPISVTSLIRLHPRLIMVFSYPSSPSPKLPHSSLLRIFAVVMFTAQDVCPWLLVTLSFLPFRCLARCYLLRISDTICLNNSSLRFFSSLESDLLLTTFQGCLYRKQLYNRECGPICSRKLCFLTRKNKGNISFYAKVV